MRYGSVCSGIEAATVAWHGLGWRPAFFSEIEAFPRAVLAHHYPEVPLHGDFTSIETDQYGPINLLVGGTPCQSFSIAGLRGGLDDDRGNLALEFLRLAQRTRPKWLVWENVPGVLSSNGGRDFGAILSGMVELGYGIAYRVLDAQFFGVPQRRRRVFVVGHLGYWRRAAAVLFERHSLQGHPAPRREKRQSPAGCARASLIGGFDYENNAHGIDEPTGPLLKGSPTGGGRPLPAIAFNKQRLGEYSEEPVASTVSARDYKDATDLVAFTAKDYGNDAAVECSPTLRCGGKDGGPVWPAIAFKPGQSADARSIGAQVEVAQAFAENQKGDLRLSDQAGSLATTGGKPGQGYQAALTGSAVRRLTPVECERLQGFPDDYTQIPYRGKPAEQCPDGPRYKALGNSMAVPVMRWIGERIQMVENLTQVQAA